MYTDMCIYMSTSKLQHICFSQGELLTADLNLQCVHDTGLSEVCL